jgi:hypothetical protein
MSEKRAKRLRREAAERGDVVQPKRYFKPITVPMKSGRIDMNGEPEVVENYIPRKNRRKIMRMFMADYRKGRLPKQEES